MPLQDSIPERRNLMVTSLGFIAYYFGGGTVTDSQLKLPVVNVAFANTTILAGLAWISIFWFLLRYWQTTKGKIEKEGLPELATYKNRKYLISNVENTIGRKLNVDGGIVFHPPWIHDGKFGIAYTEISNPTFNPDGEVLSYNPGTDGILYFKGLRGRFVLARMLASCAIQKRSFSDYVVPYLLFGLAMIGASLHLIQL